MNSHVMTLPKGFKAAGMAAGIKKSGTKDLALVVSEVPCVAAGTFTKNNIKAAPVRLCMQRLMDSSALYGIVANSGNANACTGEQGKTDALRMAQVAEQALGLPENALFVCSTGRIGIPLPMSTVEKGIRDLAPSLRTDGGVDASDAILTTDTHRKVITRTVKTAAGDVTLSAMAKGAGMIEPNMATMFTFILTDACVDQASLQEALSESVANSFNRISVDGDMSTNDTVLCLANGLAGNAQWSSSHLQWKAFKEVLDEVCLTLALDIVRDGEGAKKLVTINIEGAATTQDAECVARSIANSLLVKTSWVGNDANWGRVIDCIGYSGATIQEDRIDISYSDIPAVRGGLGISGGDEQLHAAVGSEAFSVQVDLHMGEGAATVYTCECSEEYVQINI
ncbi:MAG: bifunctional glutamate N-acetyltransferase/amino-acid acetyltransferase ArgJ [Spartobacteria bacterium]|nr:bifunctional glutamate N-acetyltransferase/amino-acid acetyltransferase ArgJ [Spartobacteria bacterium]